MLTVFFLAAGEQELGLALALMRLWTLHWTRDDVSMLQSTGVLAAVSHMSSVPRQVYSSAQASLPLPSADPCLSPCHQSKLQGHMHSEIVAADSASADSR